MKMQNYSNSLFRTASAFLTALTLAGFVQCARSAEPTSPSDLLEKGIYSQETKGDLDAAITLYQQVITEARDTEALAAQAEYRLGICYYKKRDFSKATATFEKLIKDFPNQKDLVVLAQEYLAGAVSLLPAPWVDGEQLRLDIKLASGFRLGFAAYGANATELNGRKIWRVSSRLFAGVQQISSVEVDADSFKPLHSHWKHTLLGDVDAVYSPGRADLKFKTKDEVKKIDIEGVVYDNEECVQLFRRLPLATNYCATIRIITTLGGGAIIPLKVEVLGVEKVEVPAGSFECYKVELSVHQTFWYSTGAQHYLVKFEAGGVTAELATIRTVPANQPVSYQVPSQAMTLSAPSGWMFDFTEPDEARSPSKTVVFDPDGTANSVLFVNSLDNLKPEERKSLRVCAESQIADGYKTLKDLKVRPDSWTERTVAGQPAISVVADFVEGHEKKSAYAVFAFVNTNAVEFLTYTATADFEAFRPKFEAIIDSFKANPSP